MKGLITKYSGTNTYNVVMKNNKGEVRYQADMSKKWLDLFISDNSKHEFVFNEKEF